MDELFFWLLAGLVKALSRRSRDASTEARQEYLQSRDEPPRLEDDSQTVPPADSSSASVDVWEEYRKKQEMLHRVHQSRAPKS